LHDIGHHDQAFYEAADPHGIGHRIKGDAEDLRHFSRCSHIHTGPEEIDPEADEKQQNEYFGKYEDYLSSAFFKPVNKKLNEDMASDERGVGDGKAYLSITSATVSAIMKLNMTPAQTYMILLNFVTILK
jgi:hypothetical protein